MNQEKKLQQLEVLNKAILKGRVRFALHFALILTFGVGIAQIFLGSGLRWILMEAWISFGLFFLGSYFWMWHRNIKQAAQIVDDYQTGVVATPPEGDTKSWVIFCVVLAVLVSPMVFKNQIKDWAKNFAENAKVELHISYGEGPRKTLEIPQLYLQKKMSNDFGFSLFDQNVTQLALAALLPDMKPRSLSAASREGTVRGKKVVYYTKGAVSLHPASNPDAVVILMKNQLIEMNDELTTVFYDKVLNESPYSTQETEEYGLKVQSGALRIRDEDGKEIKSENAKMGVSLRSNSKKVIVACEKKICALFMTVPDIAFLQVHFNSVHYKDWESIHDKTIDLFQSFVQP